MKIEKETEYGRLKVGRREELFTMAVELVAAQHAKSRGKRFDWALTGGSTPQDWYRWCVANRAIPESVLRSTCFTVSDERCVPLHSDQSNFGNADRLLLTPLQITAAQQQPWPVHLLPNEAAEMYAEARHDATGRSRAYDVCFLGMGDDGHTASIFPKSPLLDDSSGRYFTALDVPGKGWRLTITPAGLAACGLIILMVLGAGKAAMLKRVFTGPHAPAHLPVQMMRGWSERVVWLVDSAAMTELSVLM